MAFKFSTDQVVPAEELIHLGKGLRDAELGFTVPFKVVQDETPFEYILRADKDRLEADKKRLDWWESHPCLDWGTDGDTVDGTTDWVISRIAGNINDREWVEIARAKTLRGAIDAAIEKGDGK